MSEEEKQPLSQEPPTTYTQETVVTVQPVATEQQVQFRDYPVWITDNKGNQVQTEIRYKNGIFTWVAVGITCLVGLSFGLPCVGLIPLCIKAFKDVEHVNPNDGTVVGYYDRGNEVGLTRKRS